MINGALLAGIGKAEELVTQARQDAESAATGAATSSRPDPTVCLLCLLHCRSNCMHEICSRPAKISQGTL